MNMNYQKRKRHLNFKNLCKFEEYYYYNILHKFCTFIYSEVVSLSPFPLDNYSKWYFVLHFAF